MKGKMIYLLCYTNFLHRHCKIASTLRRINRRPPAVQWKKRHQAREFTRPIGRQFNFIGRSSLPSNPGVAHKRLEPPCFKKTNKKKLKRTLSEEADIYLGNNAESKMAGINFASLRAEPIGGSISPSARINSERAREPCAHSLHACIYVV